ncbi:MAG: L,D-transpeptidase family protein [Sulfurovum sp.]|nr:L,D-transpeptidase family protein [Sulfurovum sp.]
MNNKLPIFLIMSMMIFLSGCIQLPHSKGWSYSQKQEFIRLLRTDKYLSICHYQALASEVIATRNTSLMNQMLLAYTKNLANSCINLAQFDTIQAQRKANGVETHYTHYLQEVKDKDIMRQLDVGLSIEKILSPYIPKNTQFTKLLKAYKNLEKQPTFTAVQLNKLRVNIERVKIMNDAIGEDYILVNIPEFMVRVKKGAQTTLKFKIVVGRKHLQTPIFAQRLKYVTLNPQWSVPDSIARNEVIPGILKNANYLKRHRLVVRKTYDLNSAVMRPSTADYRAYRGGKGAVPFKFIEVPSRYNALGRVKFIFPNEHSVYMHDTQMKKLFARPVRCYSHGCVRLQKPNDLLSYVTTHYTDNTLAQVNTWYKSMKTHYLKLNKNVLVHTAYLTAYVREDGKLVMFNDVYAFDKYQKLTFRP